MLSGFTSVRVREQKDISSHLALFHSRSQGPHTFWSAPKGARPRALFKLNEFAQRSHYAKILDKINGTSRPPLPLFQRCQNSAILLFRAFIIAFGGWVFTVPIYFFQDCRYKLTPDL